MGNKYPRHTVKWSNAGQEAVENIQLRDLPSHLFQSYKINFAPTELNQSLKEGNNSHTSGSVTIISSFWSDNKAGRDQVTGDTQSSFKVVT